jgi:hypothetical protein
MWLSRMDDGREQKGGRARTNWAQRDEGASARTCCAACCCLFLSFLSHSSSVGSSSFAAGLRRDSISSENGLCSIMSGRREKTENGCIVASYCKPHGGLLCDWCGERERGREGEVGNDGFVEVR